MPERLIVEITERVAIQDVDALRGFVTRLKNFGSLMAARRDGEAGYRLKTCARNISSRRP
jgi:hypothetical protein